MQQMYSCPRCQTAVSYGQSACTNCGVVFDWEGISAPPQYDEPQAGGNQERYPQQQRYGRRATRPKKKSSSRLVIPLIVCLFILLIAGAVAFAINANSSTNSSSTQPSNLTSPSAPPVTATPPAVTSFSVNPPTITAGATTNLSWDVSSATSVSIDQGIGTIPSSGTQIVSPTETTTYTLTATNSAGSVTSSATVTVNQMAKPVIAAFTANPTTINAGQSSTLQWNITGATSVSINPGGAVSSSGTQVVTPAATTTYTLTASSSAGSVTSSATVTVAAALPVITTFTASPTIINAGQSSTLQWIITGATSISIDQGIGTPPSAYGQAVSPTDTTTYTLTAANSAGSVTSSATVTVNQTAVPVVTAFTASPTTIDVGQSSTLQWNITGAASISMDQGVGAVSSSGTQIVSPTATTAYTLTATNSIGSTTAKATVTVTTTLPVITTFTASPTTINADQSSTLQWNSTGATAVSINPGGAVSSSGTQIVSPAATTTYILTATNSFGSTTATATVTVAATLPIITTFTASPPTINAGQSSTLQWNITGATSISIDQGIGTPTNPWGQVVSPAVTTTYTLTATNSVGSVNSFTTVTVH